MRRYHPVLVVLHWLLAAMIILALIMGGFVLSETPNDDPTKLYGLRAHMSVGLAILALMLVRFVVRFFTEKPPHADIGNPTLNKLGVATHWAFYVLVIGMAGSGIATAQMAGLPAIVFGGSGAALPETFFDYPPRVAHGIIGSLLGLLVIAHIAAALYHQYVRRDGLLSRMAFGARKD